MARTKTTELLDMIYDKLMNNTSYEQFDPEMAEQLTEQYQQDITEWVKKNFGQSEAEDPSWNIEALADYLAGVAGSVYAIIDQGYVETDVRDYAERMGYKLTEQQIGNVADKIRNSDWYCSISSEDMEWYIRQELEKGE